MKLPTDISEDFQESWTAFTEIPATKALTPDVLAECFRIFLQQAGIKIQTLKQLKDYLTVNKLYDKFVRIVTTKYLFYQLQPVQHKYEIDLHLNKLVNTVNTVTVRGRVKLKPQRFALKYLLERMVTLRVFPNLPEQLRAVTDYKTKKAATDAHASKPPGSMQQLRDRHFVLVHRDPNIVLKVARLKGDFLVMDYAVTFNEVFPMYPNVEKQLTALWRRATIGDFR